jgi:hypothetical protein
MCVGNDKFAAVWGRPAQGLASCISHSPRPHGGNPLARRVEQKATFELGVVIAHGVAVFNSSYQRSPAQPPSRSVKDEALFSSLTLRLNRQDLDGLGPTHERAGACNFMNYHVARCPPSDAAKQTTRADKFSQQ